jgi:hypothetical protein
MGFGFLFGRDLSYLLCEMQDVVGGWSVVRLLEEERFARGANAHLIDDETVAKMGHPILLWVRPGPPVTQICHGLEQGHPPTGLVLDEIWSPWGMPEGTLEHLLADLNY